MGILLPPMCPPSLGVVAAPASAGLLGDTDGRGVTGVSGACDLTGNGYVGGTNTSPGILGDRPDPLGASGNPRKNRRPTAATEEARISEGTR